MTPAAALDEQIKRYRQMTGEQRLQIALDLRELACDVAREGIRDQHPNASLKNFARVYAPLADRWAVWDNQVSPPLLVLDSEACPAGQLDDILRSL